MNLPSFDHALDLLVRWTWQTTLSATVLIALVLAVQFLGRRVLPPRWQYALGLLVLLRLALPFAPASSWSVFNLANRFAAPSQATAAHAPLETPATPAAMLMPEAPGIAPLPQASIAVSRVAPASGQEILRSLANYLWLAGCLAMVALIARRHRQFIARLRRWEPVREPRVLELLAGCQARLGVRRRITVLAADSLNTPALFGVFRPRLLIPAEMLRNLEDGELRHIFLHELVHLRRGDVLVNWAALLLRAVHWFNPFVWLALRRLRADQELACDAAVIGRLAAGEQLRYGSTLIKLLADFPAPDAAACPGAVPFITHKQTIKRRIQMIANFKPAGRFTLAASLALVAALACATFTRAADNAGAAAHPNAAPSAEQSPVASPAPQPANEANAAGQPSGTLITVFVAADGTATLGGNSEQLNREQLREALRAEVENDPHVRLNIQAVSATKFADLAWLVDLANQLKITGITLHAAPATGRYHSRGGSPQSFQMGDAQETALWNELRDLNNRIAFQQQAMAQFAGYPAPDSPGSSNALAEAQSQVNQTILEKQREVIEKQTLFDHLNKLASDELRQVLPTTVPDALLTQLLQDLNAAQAKYAALRANVGANHPEAASAEALVAKLNAQAEERVKGILQGLKTQVETDREVVATLKRQLSEDALRSQYDQYNQAKAAYDQLKAASDQVLAKLAAYHQARVKADAQNEPGAAPALEGHDTSQQPPAASSTRTLASLENQIAELDGQIRQGETNLEMLRSKVSRSPGLAGTGDSSPDQGPATQLQLNAQLLQLKAQASETEETLKRLHNLAPEELPQVVVTVAPDAIILGLLNDLNAAKSELAALSTTLATNHPNVQAVRALIADKNAQIAARAKGILAGLQVRIESTKAQIKQVEDTLQTAKARELEVAGLTTPYDRAREQLQQLKDLRNVLAERVGQATNPASATNGRGR